MTASSRTASRLARTTLALLAAVATALATLVAVAAVPAEAAPTRIDPERLERGPDATAAYVDGHTIHDGGTTTGVRGGSVQLLGTRPDGRYVVLVHRDDRWQVRAQKPEGSSRKILGDVPGSFDVILGGDGTTLVTGRLKNRPRRHTLLRAYDSTTGVLLGTRKRQGYLNPLDADGGTVVYAAEAGAVVSWDLTTGTGSRVSDRYGYRADLANDRLVVFTKDPYRGGCTRVSLLSDASQVLWRSCDEAVRALSPDGSHLLTVFMLSDGLGPTEVHVRTVEGEETGLYEVDGFFERFLFEDGETVLLGAVTRDSRGLARCHTGDCELASDLGAGEPWL